MTTETRSGRSRSEKKRRQIMEAAAELFTETGLEGTSMNQVAERAGVSKQTVYSHFGNKDELFKQCIHDKCISNTLAPELLQTDVPPEEVLLELARHFMAMVLSDEAVKVMRVCISGAEQYPEVSRMLYEARPDALHKRLMAYLTEQTRKGTLAVDQPDYAAWQLMRMIEGDPHFRALMGLDQTLSPEQRDEYLRSSVSMFLRAYAGV